MHARQISAWHIVLSALVLALALAAGATRVAAHAFPESSDPAPGENLQTAPTEVSITFDEEIDPDGSSFRVVDGAGTEVGTGDVDLTVADRNVLRGDVAVSEPGLYKVAWTALSIDGDTTHGSFTFGFQASEAVPSDAPQEENPDTAMPADHGDGTLSLLGQVVLFVGLIAMWRAVNRRLVR